MITAHIIGHLTKDPETKQGNNGPFVVFSVASNNRPKGNGKSEATFVNGAFFGLRGSTFLEHHKKGDRVYLIGELSERKYENDGQSYTSLDLVASDFSFIKDRETEETQTTSPAPVAKSAKKASTEKKVVESEEFDPFASV